MGLGKINTFIDIILVERIKDDEGFSKVNDNILATIRAYKEERHASEKWANRALFSETSALFRFRKIPDVGITSKMVIDCSGDRYEIISVEDIKNRGMYVEVLAKKVVVSDG
ncbi:MAG: head-tail adaptor protein [Tissierellaceae bacterium]